MKHILIFKIKPEYLRRDHEISLTRLCIDTIDLYYSHSDDWKTPVEVTLEAYHRLIKAGKVRFIGASNYLA